MKNATVLFLFAALILGGMNSCKGGKQKTINGFDVTFIEDQKGDLAKEGDYVYLYTDGYADQFGGSHGKKLKYKQLEEMLMTNTHLDMNAQSEILNSKFENWKGNLEQVDDVTIIGIRI